ncbi:hypothetical protein V8F06_003231 [Rhypophila decipiens]
MEYHACTNCGYIDLISPIPTSKLPGPSSSVSHFQQYSTPQETAGSCEKKQRTASEEEKNGLPATRVLPDMESVNEEHTEADYDGALPPTHDKSTKRLELALANEILEILENGAAKVEIKKAEGSAASTASRRVVVFTFHFIYNLLCLFVLHYYLPVHWTDKAYPLLPSLARFSNGGILVKSIYCLFIYRVGHLGYSPVFQTRE